MLTTTGMLNRVLVQLVIIFCLCVLQDYFHNRVAQLIFTFPEDALTSTGMPFWSAPKRCPKPLNFDAHDPSHASFVQARRKPPLPLPGCPCCQLCSHVVVLC